MSRFHIKIYPLLWILLWLLPSINLEAQKQKDWIELGHAAFEKGDFYGARHYFENALEMDSSKAALQYQYAQTLRKINDYSGAEKQYYKVYRKGRGRYFPKGIYWIALMNEYTGDYTKALKFWKKYRTEDEDEIAKVVQHKKSCEFAQQYLRDTRDSVIISPLFTDTLEVVNAGRKINSAASEFGIAAIGDSILYYGSLRGDYSEKDVLLEPEYDIKIYRSTLKRKHHRFTIGKPISDRVNMPEMITANGTFNQDNTLFFYTQCDANNHCKLMVADYHDGQFSHVHELTSPVNLPNHSSTQPSLCMEKGIEYLFFSSDRPGGEGKHDIWYCSITKDKPGEIHNAGRHVNTPENEITPYYDAEKKGLFFSSDWHEGFGGFDIFFSAGSIEAWGKPANLLPPLNTSTNDMYFWISQNNQGYLTSNRKGSLSEQGETCCNDIWIFQPLDQAELLSENKTSKDTLVQKTLGDREFEKFKSDSILPTINGVRDLSKYLPITLYFHNDHPNPKTTATTTALTYSQTYEEYIRLKWDYMEQYAGGNQYSTEADELEDFFGNKLKLGHDKLDYMCRLLERELNKGSQIELVIKGYASPLSNSDYNKNLTLRRIRSLINELNTWHHGSLLPFIQGAEGVTGRLTFKEIPYGESKAASNVSDNTDNRSHSVYSPSAARERRIEILEVKGK